MSLPRARRRVGAWPAHVAGALGIVTAAITFADPRPDTLLRHAYLVVVVAAGVRGGAAAGVVTAIAAMLLDAPFVLPAIERVGLGRGEIEGLATFVVLALVGASTGMLATWGRRERRRYGMLLRVQHALTEEVPLADALERVRAAISTGVGGGDVGVVVSDAERAVVAGIIDAPAAAVEAALAGRGVQFIPDLGDAPRPRRVVVAPIVAASRVLGALSITRVGELPRRERATVATAGAYLGLALENARLAATQRRFAAELREKVTAATRELHALDHAKSTFVAIASHELRTPLTALRGFSELLGIRAFSADEVRRFARVMQDETARLVRIVDDLLDLSRLEQGLAPQLRRAVVDPAAAILAVATLFAGADDARRLEIDCAVDLPAAHADPDALDRILKNLVSNAMKYSPCGPIRVAARARGGAVEFVVEDHGPGIPAEALPRVFEPYFRVGGGASAARGTGLGLAVVRSLVEAHGGSIAVESAREIGTRVTFTIPSVP